MITPYRLLRGLTLGLSLCCIFSLNAQNGIGIKYLRDYIQNASPSAGIIYSYDSITSESSLSAVLSGDGFMTAMLAAGQKEKASRRAFASYEPLTSITLSKVHNLNNISFKEHNDEILHSGNTHSDLATMMQERNVDLLFHVIFDPVFLTKENDRGSGTVLLLKVTVQCRVYSKSAESYFEMPLYYMSRDLSEPDSPAAGPGTTTTTTSPPPGINQIQGELAKENISGYAQELAYLKSALEDTNTPKAVGIIRSVADDKRVTMESNITPVGVGGFSKTVGDINTATEVTPDDPPFGIYSEATYFTEGLVIALIGGDNPTTSYQVETSYEVPIAELVVREGSKEAAICKINKLPKDLTLEDLVGMKVIPKNEANVYLTNPKLERNPSSLAINKGPADDSFLSEVRTPKPPKRPPAPTLSDAMSKTKEGFASLGTLVTGGTEMFGGMALPLDDYQGNTRVFPLTTIESSSYNFEDKVKEMKPVVAVLESKGYKVGIVFSTINQYFLRSGILQEFTDDEVRTFLRGSDKVMETTPDPQVSTDSFASFKSTGAPTQKALTPDERLTQIGLAETKYKAIPDDGTEGMMLDYGSKMVKSLNETYGTDIFELVDYRVLPKQKKAFDLPKTQYKTLGSYAMVVSKNSISSTLKFVYINKKGKGKILANRMMQAQYSFEGELSAEEIAAFENKEAEELKKFVSKMK